MKGRGLGVFGFRLVKILGVKFSWVGGFGGFMDFLEYYFRSSEMAFAGEIWTILLHRAELIYGVLALRNFLKNELLNSGESFQKYSKIDVWNGVFN